MQPGEQLRSNSIASTRAPRSASGWARRVSEKRRTSAAVVASKNRLHADAFALQLREQRQQVRQRAGAADVDGDGDAPVAALRWEAQELAQELGREVVDAEEPGVFERVQRHGFA